VEIWAHGDRVLGTCHICHSTPHIDLYCRLAASFSKGAAIDSKRNQLLQRLLEIKTITYVSKMELIDLFEAAFDEMDPLKERLYRAYCRY